MKTTTTIDTRKTIDSYDIEGFYCGEWSIEEGRLVHSETDCQPEGFAGL